VFVHTSSDLRALAGRLAGIVSAPGLGPLEREVVLIQSAGMQRFLSRELAERLGIAANFDFPFPRAFLQRTLGQLLGDEEVAQRYEREALRWEIYALLGQVHAVEGYELVRRYLGESLTSLSRLHLAEQLAHLYDQYLTYRPRLIRDWESGQESPDFQSDLWRRLRERLGPHHLAQRSAQLLHEITDEQIRAALPARISLVGGPGLPPLYLEVLARLGRAIEVHVLSLLPTGAWLADLHPYDDPLPELGRGAHPLLASMGRLAADYQLLLQQVEHTQCSEEFPLPEETTLLSALQHDITEASCREPGRLLPAAVGRDGSITLDSCHSRLREVEVLRDRLLGWFHEDPSLKPEDIVVLSPDIEAYSPLITAVFSARVGEGAKIPFRIADRSEGSVNAAARALLLGVKLLAGRLKASEVLDFVQSEPVTARFELSMVDLERMGDWVGQAGIRFGADRAHLAELGLTSPDGEPELLGSHTWQTGLERLLLGYALEDDGQSWFQGLVPVDDVPAGEADLLGRFAEFVQHVLDFRRRARSGATAGDWQQFLVDFVRAFLAEGEAGDWDVDAALAIALDVCRDAKAAVPEELLDLETLHHLLAGALGERQGHSDFLSYGVTFCALLPLRTIPFRRVCVLGLDQASFPRRDQPHELDLTSEQRRPGDRSLRAEDRQLFLEWIVGARERLALSYVGRSVQDDTECPVSVVVAELSAVLDEMVEPAARPVLAARQHPLQPFSPRYFTPGTGVVSFDQENYSAARALVSAARSGARRRPAFYDGPLSPEVTPADQAGDAQPIELGDLVRFWKDPARAFLSRLRVVIDDDIDQFEDRETVGLDGLARYQIGDDLLVRRERGQPIVREVELGRGRLPLGAAGELELGRVAALAARLGIEAGRRAPNVEPRWADIDLVLDLPDAPLMRAVDEVPGQALRVRIVGRLQVRGDLLLDVGFRRASARAKLGLWIQHLVLSAAGLAERSILVARPAARWGGSKSDEKPETVTFSALPPIRARAELARLVAGYLAGQTAPLCFAPEASMKLVEEARKLRASREPPVPEVIRRTSLGRAHKELEEAVLFFEVFRDEDPRVGLSSARADEFERLSHEVLEPMLECERTEEDA